MIKLEYSVNLEKENQEQSKLNIKTKNTSTFEMLCLMANIAELIKENDVEMDNKKILHDVEYITNIYDKNIKNKKGGK